MFRTIIMAAVVSLALFAGAENRIYQGNYATGIAKWTVKSYKLYEGNYATGIAKWTLGEASGVLKIYQGNYATGIAKFCFKGNKFYEGNYATGIAKWTIAMSDSTLKIYQGNYATGIAKYSFKSNKLYTGNYATGIAKWTFSATNEIPDALLVFLATQILFDDATPSSGSSGSSSSPTVIPDVDPQPTTQPSQPSQPTTQPSQPTTQPSQPSVEPSNPSKPSKPAYADLSYWWRSRTLRGVLKNNARTSAVVEVKCGKMDRWGSVKVSAKVTPVDGRKRSYRSQRLWLRQQDTQTVVWDGLRLEITGNQLAGREFSSDIVQAAVGGDLRDGIYTFSADCASVPPPENGYAVMPDQFPTRRRFTIARNKWTFPKAKDDPAAVKITYNARTGAFKGSFKALQSNEGYTTGRVRIKKTTVKLNGFVVNGKGEGKATAKKPPLSFDIAVNQ